MFRDKTFYFSICLTIACFFSVQAQVKDTLIIKFDSSHPEMRKGKMKVPYTDGLFSYYYHIKKRISKKDEYRFITVSYPIQSQKTIDYFDSGYINPITKTVNKSYLKNKLILDISFFRKTPYEEIKALLMGKNPPFKFIYEVGKSKNGKILLREVRMIGDINQ